MIAIKYPLANGQVTTTPTKAFLAHKLSDPAIPDPLQQERRLLRSHENAGARRRPYS
jgi:hypothetical protein